MSTDTKPARAPTPSPTGDRLITKAELRAMIPLSQMTVWRMCRAGELPAPCLVGRRPMWLLSEISAYIESRPREFGPRPHGPSHAET